VCVWLGGNELGMRATLTKYGLKWDDDVTAAQTITSDFNILDQPFHMGPFIDETCDSALVLLESCPHVRSMFLCYIY